MGEIAECCQVRFQLRILITLIFIIVEAWENGERHDSSWKAPTPKPSLRLAKRKQISCQPGPTPNGHAGMPAPTTLCPGFRHVEEFDPNEEYESGEEVSYVTFDLGNIEPTLVPSSSTYRLIVSELELPLLCDFLTEIRRTGARYSHSLPPTVWDHSERETRFSSGDGTALYGRERLAAR